MTHSKTVPVRALAWLLMLVMLVSMMPGVPLVAQAAGTEGMITIEMTDSYGDGWSDNAIEIYANGKLVATVTMTSYSPSETWTGKLDPHATYNFKWVEGRYAGETGFVIYMGTTKMCSASGSDYSGYDTIFSTAPVCAAPSFEDGVCTKCGTACAHDIDADGQCGICGYICPDHSFVGGACSTCGGACPHAAVLDGECKACKGTVNLIIDMTAQYYYGWENCGSITIFADGTEIGVAKLESAYTGSWSAPYSSIYTYTFHWDRESWPQECSFTVKIGNEVFYTANNDECSSLSDGVFLTINPNCSNHTSFDENFLCNECGLPCTHKAWTDSVCDACGFACGTDAAHDWDLGTCKVCDLSCSHSWTDYVCDTCGFACGTDLNHSFGGDQECDVCGFACGTDAAHDWDLGTCKVCDLSCSHSWTDYVCDTCGFACGTDADHSFGGDQECDVCGFACGTDSNHAWSKGVCGSCGAVCPHERYENAMCTVCGYYEPAVQNGVGANGFALYEIYNASQLLWFADYVNSGEILKTHTFYDAYDAYSTYYTTGCVNAKLMADIDMTGLPWVPIGAYDLQFRGYTGVFEGNGHTVSGIDCTATSEEYAWAGFFRVFHGTVKNLNVQGSFKAVTTGQYRSAYAGGIVAEGTPESYVVGYEAMAYVHEDVYPVIENCTFIGTLSAEANNMTWVGGIAGFLSEGTMTNCLAAATVTSNACDNPRAGALVGANRNSSYTNCYYDSTLCALEASVDGALEGVTGLATADFADGAVAYKLGFGQTLGTDTYPTCGGTPVYQVTTGCATYSNTQAEPTEKAHVGAPTCTQAALCQNCGEYFGEALGHGEYGADGKCSVCGEYDMPKQNGVGANGFALYEIENASQLLWFANYVNSCEVLKTHTFYDDSGENFTYYTTGCLNAKLMADIDMTGLPWSPIGVRGIQNKGYTGVFDGNGHTVSGIDCSIVTSDDYAHAGFFGEFHGTVKNLTVRGSFKSVCTNDNYGAYAGGIAGLAEGVYYMVGANSEEAVYPVIENCTFIGSVSAEAEDMTCVGGIAGHLQNGTMTNCLAAATVTSNECANSYPGALVGRGYSSTYTNCYYDSTLCALEASVDGALEGVTGLATADFADGAVAYKLGFGQTLGTDAYPTYGDDKVYLATTTCVSYTNTDCEPVEKPHSGGEATCKEKAVCAVCGEHYGQLAAHPSYDTDAKCTYCGEYDMPKQNGVGANGFALYEIENASQLLWFAQYVNSGEVLKTHNFDDGTGEIVTYFTTGCLNAKLMADIDMTGLPWSPIGAKELGSRGYTGVFEGNGHTVSGIDCIVTSDDDVYAGFFREFHGTVKNLTVRGSFKAVTTATNERAYAGGIAAYCNNSSFYVSGETEYVYPVIENCTFIGTVSAESSKRIYSGGIAGYFGKGTMTNCLAAATVTSNGGGSVRAGALVACNDGSTYTNCYYDSTLCNLDACGDEEITGVTSLATADFADGAVAYALGFGQTLGTDAYPTYGDDQVFQVLNCKEETAYSNTDSNIGHTWATIDCETPITCSTCGATDGDAKGHDWKDATCAAPKTCSNCGATEGYPDYDNHAGEITVVFDWNDPYEGECYVNAYLHCGLCETNISSTSGYGLLTGTVEATDCLNPGSETYEITVELEGQTYTDTHTFVILSENHVGEPVNGFCSACNGYQAAVWNEEKSVYEISNAGQLYWYAQYLNTTNAEIYAELVADIIIPENAPNWEPINASYAYFNGNYHTISGLKCIGDENMTYVGLFGCEGWWYEISNLHIENSYFEGKEYVGAVVACMTNGGSITNCAVTNTMVTSDGDYAGTLAGYLSVGSVINCFVDTDTLVGGYSNGYVTIENSYYLSDTETEDGGKTAAQFASGEVAYLLQSGIAEEDIYDEDWNWIGSYIPEIWGQTIGEEAYPTLGSAKVYPRLNCLEEICGYSNTEGESLDHDWIDATCATAKTCKLCGETEGEALGHQFDENGFCILINDGNACDAYEPAELVEGVYQISNAGQLYWFAAQVNSGETSINAKVMNDVTVNTGDVKGCNGTKADGWRTWTPIGNSTEKYTGTFDGGSFTVSGLYFNDSYSSYGGLFGYVGTGTVENVGVVNSYFCAYTSSGGIVGENEGGIVANCYGNICVSAYLSSGGIAGYNAGTVKNCHSNVTLNANYDGGGVVGSNYGAVMNCYSIGSIGGANSGSIVGCLYSDGTVTNCYYDQTGRGGINGSEVAGQAEAKTAEQFASGEVAYLLGETWGQTIGEDAYPVLGGDKVYQTLNCKGETVYSNTEINGAHMWLDATCTESKTCSVCGETEGEALGHDWKAATCTAPKTCLNCGALEGDVDSDNHASTDYIYQYYRNGYFEKHEKFHACCSASVGMENHSYNEQTGLCNQCGAEILIVVEMVNAPTEYLIHVEYALRRGGRSATLLKDYTNTKSYTVAVDELFFAEGVTLTNNGTLVMPEGFDLSTLEKNYNGTGVVTIGDASYVWNGEKFVCAGDHSWQDATCTTPKTCDLCKETEGKALGHNYGNDEVCDRCGKFGWIDLLVESYIVEGAENVTVNSDGSWTVTGNITLLPNVTFDYDVFAWLAQTLTADAEVSITVLDMDPNGLYGTNWITLYSLWGDSNAYPAGIHDRIDSIKDVYDFNVEYSGWGNTGTATFRAIYIEPVGTVTLNTLELRTSGCKHSYELIDSSAATCTGNGTATYSCAICGDSYTETIPATGKHVDGDNSGRCDTCNCLMQPALLRMVSISLKGNIALNYYMLLSDEVLADSTAYMQFTMADGEVIQLPVSQGVKHEYYGETYYVFSCEVNAKEMTDDVVSQFFYEGGSTEVHSYSVQTYAKSILATSDNEDVKELVKAMLNYGAASQTHFGYNTDNMANAELEEPDYSGVTISGFNTGAGQGTELAKFYSASLILKSETTLRFFFTAPITATYDGQALEVKERGGLYYVDVVGIAARNLDEDVTITINDGVSTAEVTYNPMAYCAAVLDDTTGAYDQQMKDLVVALYLYNQAANVYLEEN